MTKELLYNVMCPICGHIALCYEITKKDESEKLAKCKECNTDICVKMNHSGFSISTKTEYSIIAKKPNK